MEQYVLKASGKKELFSDNKIYSSLLKAGASPKLTSETVEKVKTKLNGEIGTDKVYHFYFREIS
ncbi:MAG: hypothetical protein M1365_16585 [Actinobacteria bacterium]|nr:hypothetical protein [Actinomycetota bacterium]